MYSSILSLTLSLDGHVQAALPPGKDTVPMIQEVGWAPGPVRRGAENLTPTRVRFLGRQARSESLDRLSYSDPLCALYPFYLPQVTRFGNDSGFSLSYT